MKTIDDDIAWWKAQCDGARSKRAALLAFGAYAGLKIAKSDYLKEGAMPTAKQIAAMIMMADEPARLRARIDQLLAEKHNHPQGHTVGERVRKLANHVEALNTGSDDAKLLFEAADALDVAQPWSCQARPWEARDPPQDCDWPFCGCDPNASKVLTALDERGFLKRSGYEG